MIAFLRASRFSGALILALAAAQAAAPLSAEADTLPRAAHAAFSQVASDEDAYSPLACHINVQHLLRALRRKGLNLWRWNVVYVSEYADHPAIGRYFNGSGLDPMNPRGGPIHWNFHVFLESRGWVLDLDYTDTPFPVPLQVYLATQFNPLDLSKLGVRVYRGDRYLRQYSDELPEDLEEPFRNWAWYLYDGGGAPIQTLCEWAASLP
ncbi:MAG: hypothetical protein IT285_01780 [Bdellovibrionales bacterium]|nr:hypothetical protein [Bdellovibrionales bacterium]